MIARLPSRLTAWIKVRARHSLTTHLLVGFSATLIVAALLLLVVIVIGMQQRLYSNLDRHLKRYVETVYSQLQLEQQDLALEAGYFSTLVALDQAVAAGDTGRIERLLSPLPDWREANAFYVVGPDRALRIHIGDPLPDEENLALVAPVRRAFEGANSSGRISGGDSIWLIAAAPNRAASGGSPSVVVLAKRIDRSYLHQFSERFQDEVALSSGGSVAYSSDVHLPLTTDQLRASAITLDEFQTNPTARENYTLGDLTLRTAIVALPLGEEPMTVAIFQDTSVLVDNMWVAVGQFSAITLGILLLGTGLGYMYVRGILKPIHQLGRAATAIAGGNLDEPISLDRKDEIGKLAVEFDAMRLRVKGLLLAEQEWNAELAGRVEAKTAELQSLCEVRDRLFREAVTAQEEERRRLARELHDETSQALTALLANLAAAQSLAPHELAERLTALKTATVAILQEINRIVLDLRPSLLDDLGLVPALASFAERRLRNSETRVEVDGTFEGVPLPPLTETILFRVGQEAINNIAKYAHARMVQIHLDLAGNGSSRWAELRVKDDGVGFDPEGIQPETPTGRPHLGLVGMRERLALVGGYLQIRSHPGEGSEFVASVPIEANDEEDVPREQYSHPAG